MRFRPPYNAAGDRVYQAIKAQLVAYEFPPGERIFLEPIAESLGVSTTPVREALIRLVERNLVTKGSKGFYAVTLSDARLTGHYEMTRLLLTLGLEDLPAEVRRDLPNREAIADVLNRLNRRVIADAAVLARYTGEIFGDLVALTENVAAMAAIDRANDHLHFVRTLECRHIGGVQDELKRFCELLLAGSSHELVNVIHAYHDRRIVLLPHLLRDLQT